MKNKVLAFDFGASSGRAILATYEDGKLTLEEIRRLHGSTVIKDDEEKKLNPTYKKIRAAI